MSALEQSRGGRHWFWACQRGVRRFEIHRRQRSEGRRRPACSRCPCAACASANHYRKSGACQLRFTPRARWTGTNHTTLAITQVSGPISRLGGHWSPVEAGDPLLYVSSPDVANAFQFYKKARNRQNWPRHFAAHQGTADHGAAAARTWRRTGGCQRRRYRRAK
jgi:hypothetical protein